MLNYDYAIVEELNNGLKRYPINEMHSEVKDDDGRVIYKEVGGSNNYLHKDGDYILLRKPDLTIRDADPGDNCIKKISFAKFKSGFAPEDWILGLKKADTLTQYLLKPVAIVGLDEHLNETIIEPISNDTSLSTDLILSGFSLLTLQFEPEASGVAVKHVYSKDLYDNFSQYKYFGLKWEVNNISVFECLQEFSDDFATYFKFGDLYFIEYFKRSDFEFRDPNTDEIIDIKPQLIHYYTTKSGTITTNETWTAGTYYISERVYLESCILTLDAQDGDIIIKVNPDMTGYKWAFVLNANDTTIKTVNTAKDRKVYVTSKNDNIVGEIIDGSTGTPDYMDYWAFIRSERDKSNIKILLSHVEIKYAGRDTSHVIIFFPWNVDTQNASAIIRIEHIKFRYCVYSGYRYGGGGLIGHLTNKNDMTLLDDGYIRFLEADETNKTSNEYDCISWFNLQLNYYNFEISDWYVYCNSTMWNAPTPGCGLVCRPYVSGSEYMVVKNCIFQFVPNDDKGNGVIDIRNHSEVNKDIRIKILNCTIHPFYVSQCYPCGIIIRHYNDNTTIYCEIKNNILRNHNSFATGIYQTNTTRSHVIDNDHNGFYGWHTNCDNLTQGPHSFIADPQFTINPNGNFIISDDCVFPDDHFVGNLIDYEKKGSDTFNNLGINEDTRTATGYKYSGTDKVTPGANYLGTFESPPGSSSTVCEGGYCSFYQPLVAISPIRTSGGNNYIDLRVILLYNFNTYAFDNYDTCEIDIFDINQNSILVNTPLILTSSDLSPDKHEFRRSNIQVNNYFLSSYTYRVKLIFTLSGDEYTFDVNISTSENI